MFKNTNFYFRQFVFSGDNTKVYFRMTENTIVYFRKFVFTADKSNLYFQVKIIQICIIGGE